MKRLNKFAVVLLLTPLLFTSCKGSKSLWNRTFVSNGKTYTNWSDKVSNNINITNEKFIEDNFNDINWYNSGYYYYDDNKELQVWPFYLHYYPEDYSALTSNYSNFKNYINNFWTSDKDDDEYTSFYGIKKSVDKSTFSISLNSDHKGTLTISFKAFDNTPQKDVYYVYDETDNKDGSTLSLYKGSTTLKFVGYIIVGRYTNKIDFIRIRSGYMDETAVDFKISFNNSHEGINSIDIYNAIVVNEKSFPVWAIILISVGSTGIVGLATFLIVKKVKRKKHIKKK